MQLVSSLLFPELKKLKMKKQLIAIAIVVATGVSGFAQQTQIDSTQTKLDEVIVTASSKFDLKRKDSGKPVIKITRADIEAQSAASVADLLNQYAGIEINGARSNAGQNLGYFIRGGNNRQVSFLIDGAQVSDASNIAGDFDLRLIDIDQIEEIEILKGAASTLYGANASTAVINIKFRKAPENSTRVTVSSFVGTNTSSEQGVSGVDEYNNSVQLQGSAKNGLTYAVGFNQQSTDGLSATESMTDQPNQSDAFNRVNLLGRIGYNNRKDFMLTSYVSFDEYEAQFDDFSLTDANNETYSRQVRWGTNMKWKYSENGELVYNDVSTHTRRDTRSSFPSIFNADGYSLDLYNKYSIDLGEESSLKTIVGFNFRTDSYEDFSIPFGSTEFEQNANKDVVNAQIYDPYLNVVYISDFGLNINAGARYNMHSNYDSKLVYNINPSWRVDVGENSFKAYTSYSTAYITPSLFQLYSASFGNDALEPEENATLEFGLSWTREQSSIVVSVFERNEDNLVQFVSVDPVNFISQYQNQSEEFIARGIEITAQTLLFDKVRLSGNYAFTEREGVDLLRRIPDHRANISAQISPLKGLSTTLRYEYSDIRGDAFFNTSTFASESVVLNSYQVVDFDATYKLASKDVTFFTGISNIFNEEYQELFGFQTRGRNYKIGVRLGF
jgi:vitamin B12 transporter